MLAHKPVQFLAIRVTERFDVDHFAVHPRHVEVEDVGNATGHAGGDVASGRTENHDTSTCHVLEGMVTDTFDDDGCTGVPDAATFSDGAAREDLTTGGAIREHIAGDDVVFRDESGIPCRSHHDP